MLRPACAASDSSDCDDGPMPAPPVETRTAIVQGAPMIVSIMVSLLVVEGLLQHSSSANSGQVEWRPLFYGGVAFVCAWSLHLAFATRIKRRFGMEDVSSQPFGSFTTLLGLVFSLLLGQPFSYYFARQNAIQDAAFREISELQRLLDLCLGYEQQQSFLQSRHKPKAQSSALHMLELLATEAATLAPGGDGLTAHTKLISTRRALQGVVQALSDLSTDANQKNDPATVAMLHAAQSAVTSVAEARALRVSQINADLPQAQFLTINLLGGLLLGSFLLTDLKNDQLEAVLFGAIAGVATVIKQVLGDLASPFAGSWSIEPARQAGRDLLQVIRHEISAASGAAAQ